MLEFNFNINFMASTESIPIMFLHAFPVNQKMWKPQFEFLQRKHIPYLSFDYPGFGNSSIIYNRMNMLDYGLQAKNILNSLGCEKAIFVGLSMGGYVALNLYRSYPEIFRGLLLANTRAGADTDTIRKNRFTMIDRLENNPDLTPILDIHIENFFTDQGKKLKPNLIQDVESMIRETSISGIIQALEAMANRPTSEDVLPRIDMPVTVVAGAQDKLIPLAEAEQLVKLIPDVSFQIISNAAHLSNMEQPDDFNRILWDLIETCN